MKTLQLAFACFPLCVPAQEKPAAENGPIPAAERELVDACLNAYDTAMREGDAEKILDLFCAKSPCRAEARSEALAFLKENRVASCRSTLDFLSRAKSGETLFWGAYVRTHLGYVPRPPEGSGEPREGSVPPFERMLQMNHFFLLRSDPGKATIVRMEDFDPELEPMLRAEKLGCPACNYELARPAGWFLLPRSRGWSPCTDSISILHPGGGIQADFDILECQGEADLAAIAQRDESHLTESCCAKPEQTKILARKALTPGENQRGLEIEGQFEQSCPEGSQVLKFLRIYFSQGPVLYTLNVYGDSQAWSAHAGEIEGLRKSFRIANPKLSLAELRDSMKSRHNPGGKVEQNLYSNQQYGIRIQGPNGWKAEDFSGPTLFLVRFADPQNPEVFMSFHAIEDPNGWPDELAVSRSLAEKIAKAAQARRVQAIPVEAKRMLHRGLQAFAYESEWKWPGENPQLQRICLLPSGQALYVLELTAPANRFEEQRKAFRAVLDSLSRF